MAALLAALIGCGGEPDPRIARPQATVETLLRANYLWGATSPRPMASSWSPERGELPPVPDIDAIALCIWDYDRDDPDSRAMAEFVAGMLAAGQHRLAYHTEGDRAVVVSGNRPIFLRRSSQGWHIILRESVPDEVRQGIMRGRRNVRQREAR